MNGSEEQIDTWDFEKLKVFWVARSKFSRVRRQPMEQEEICVNTYASERISVKIMLRIKKKTIKNKAINPVNKWIHEPGSSQKKCKWPVESWNVSYVLGQQRKANQTETRSHPRQNESPVSNKQMWERMLGQRKPFSLTVKMQINIAIMENLNNRSNTRCHRPTTPGMTREDRMSAHPRDRRTSGFCNTAHNGHKTV